MRYRDKTAKVNVFYLILGVLVIVFLALSTVFLFRTLWIAAAETQIETALEDQIDSLQSTTDELQDTVDELLSAVENPQTESHLEVIDETLQEVDESLNALEDDVEAVTSDAAPVSDTEADLESAAEDAVLTTTAWAVGVFSILIAISGGLLYWRSGRRRLRLEESLVE